MTYTAYVTDEARKESCPYAIVTRMMYAIQVIVPLGAQIHIPVVLSDDLAIAEESDDLAVLP